MRNYKNLGILDTVVPVPLCLVSVPNTFCMVVPVPNTFCMVVPVSLLSVPVPNGFCWVVPVPPCFGTSTTSWFLPRNANFASFGTNSLHTTSPFHNTSRTNMEFIQNHSITLVLVIWNFLYPTLGENPRTLTQVHQSI